MSAVNLQIRVAAALMLVLGAGSAPVLAQPASPTHAQSAELDAALARLGRNPRDVDALVAAGNAALAVGDTEAAVGFYNRAQALVPGSARVEAGLAGAKVLAGDPLSGIGLFMAATSGGAVLAPERVSDRGLAYDLVGDQPHAQDFYRSAMAAGAGDEARRRLAMSLAIAGDRRDFEATLRPLTDKSDPAGWRTRAFGLAVLGEEEAAVQIARAYLPANLATALAPYLRYMRRLTRAQQAAAANLGLFPLPAEIGIDQPQIVLWQQKNGLRPATLASAEPRPGMAGAQPAVSATTHDRHRNTPPPPAPPPEPMPSRENVDAAPTRLAANVALAPVPVPKPVVPPAPVPKPVAPPAPVPKPVAVAAVAPAPAPIPAPVPGPSAAPAATPAALPATSAAPANSGPSFDLAQLAAPKAASTPAAPPTATPSPPAPKPAAPSFADAFAGFDNARPEATPAPGAVDIRKVKAEQARAEQARAAQAKAEAEAAKPKPPKCPSRVWVQVGVGRSAARLATDWRHMAEDAPRQFRGRSPYTADWGRTHRLVTGPFDDEDAAKAWLAKIKPDHGDAFVWVSAAGQAVDALGGE